MAFIICSFFFLLFLFVYACVVLEAVSVLGIDTIEEFEKLGRVGVQFLYLEHL